MTDNNKPPTTPAGWMLGATYAESGACPKCGHADVTATTGIGFKAPRLVHQNMQCEGCGAEWTALYRLAGYDPKAGAA